MEKDGRWPAEGAIEENLAGRGKEQVGAPHHFSDAHRRVVHDHGEWVGRDLVVPADDEIPKVPANEK